jgi:hypothetical protein
LGLASIQSADRLITDYPLCRPAPLVDGRLNTNFGLWTEFAAQSFGGMVEKEADLGREVSACRMHDVNGCWWRFVFDEDSL